MSQDQTPQTTEAEEVIEVAKPTGSQVNEHRRVMHTPKFVAVDAILRLAGNDMPDGYLYVVKPEENMMTVMLSFDRALGDVRNAGGLTDSMMLAVLLDRARILKEQGKPGVLVSNTHVLEEMAKQAFDEENALLGNEEPLV